MLAELAIDDLVLIAEARLALSPGLNVITGETGAGKSLLAQAIGLLLGDKADESLVRQGASRALVQAVFESRGGSRGEKRAGRRATGGPDAPRELAVSRQVPREGRSRVYVDGVVSSAAAVESALRDRVAFYGQLEHAKLLQLDRQLDLLDAAAPESIGPLLTSYSEAYAAVIASSKCCASRSASSKRRRSNRARTSSWRWSASACATPRSCSSACPKLCACCRPAMRAAPSTVCVWPSVW